MAGASPDGQKIDPFADRRLYSRTELALPAFLQGNGKRHAVHLIDVSAGGAKLSCPANLEVGNPVVLDCGTLAHSAVIRWRNGDLMGLVFNTPLAAREVSALIDRSEALAAWTKSRR